MGFTPDLADILRGESLGLTKSGFYSAGRIYIVGLKEGFTGEIESIVPSGDEILLEHLYQVGYHRGLLMKRERDPRTSEIAAEIAALREMFKIKTRELDTEKILRSAFACYQERPVITSLSK